MRLSVTLLAVLLVATTSASADSVKLRAKSNCSDPNPAAAGWIPFPEGEHATLVATWKKTSKTILGAVVCEEAGTTLTFATHLGATRRGWFISAGTGGDICVVSVCSNGGGAVPVFLSLVTGLADPTFAKASSGGEQGNTSLRQGRLVMLTDSPPYAAEALRNL